MASKGYYRDPVERSCWTPCPSCFRCVRRGFDCPARNLCSGRPDKSGTRDPHPDDFCTCTQGVLRWRTKQGQLVIRRFNSTPFANNVMTDSESEDERDWNAFVKEKREQFNDPHYDPLKVKDYGPDKR